MTIESYWLHCFKCEVPSAFTPRSSFTPAAVYSDGQIHLMQNPPTSPQTWDDYIYHRFVARYSRYLSSSPTLVVAFDNYLYVPPAKCMTQTSRRKHIPPISFHESSPLPCMVPEGEMWTRSISNRIFKNKLIELISLRLPKLLLHRLEYSPSSPKEVIIDYDVPIRYFLAGPKDIRSEVLTQYPAMGEADIKFPRWALRYPKLLVDSIDGDSIPIALLQHELLLSQGQYPPEVSIYRMSINLGDKENTAPVAKKPRLSPPPSDACQALQPSTTTPTPKRPPRTYEYVSIHLLYQGILMAIKQALGPSKLESHRGHEMRMLTSLILLTGSDYTRNLPQIGPRTIWENLVGVWETLASCYHPPSMQLHPTLSTDSLVSHIYQLKFFKHIPTEVHLYSDLYACLHSSKLAPRTRDSFPSHSRVFTTIKNCNWVLQYWSLQYLQTPPHPISEQYGYSSSPNGSTRYEDEV